VATDGGFSHVVGFLISRPAAVEHRRRFWMTRTSAAKAGAFFAFARHD
jgi:hypothetical protein